MKTICLFIGMLLTGASTVSAHDDLGPNGGRIADAGNYHVEMVVKSRTIEVFVSDNQHKPVPVPGFKGIAFRLVDGKSQRIVLDPDGGRVSDTATVALPDQSKGVVQLTAPDGKTAQGRFN